MTCSSAFLLIFLALLSQPTLGFGAATPAAVLKDYSGAAAGLFNNMRTPAALIGGSIVPLGLLTAPKVEPGDSKLAKRLKYANMLLAIASLLNQVIAITYSTVAVNKIAELEFPPTAGVAEYIEKYHSLSWLGTNVHFLLGLFGFACLVIAKPYVLYGANIGNVATCWTSAAMLSCVAIVNKGIAMGHGTVDNVQAKFASNLFGLVLSYLGLLWKEAQGKVLPPLALISLLVSFVPLRKAWETATSKGDNKSD